MVIEYKLILGGVIRLSDGLTICDSIPELAEQWQEYQDWLKEGNKPAAEDKPLATPPPRDLARELDDLKAEAASMKEETASIKADVAALAAVEK